jgi:hypothetical protein
LFEKRATAIDRSIDLVEVFAPRVQRHLQSAMETVQDSMDVSGADVKITLTSSKRPRRLLVESNVLLPGNDKDQDNENEQQRKKQYVMAVENSRLDVVDDSPVEQELVIPLLPPPPSLAVFSPAPTLQVQPVQQQCAVLSLEERAAKEILRELGQGDDDDTVSGDPLVVLAAASTTTTTTTKKGTLLEDLTYRLRAAANDDERFVADMVSRAEDFTVKSDVYEAIPIDKFGAAMLRGMGWTGPVVDKNKSKKDDDFLSNVRPARMGLGASDVLRKATQLDTRKAVTNIHNINAINSNSKGLTFGEIVRVRVDSEPVVLAKLARSARSVYAKVIATRGIPGLNKIR